MDRYIAHLIGHPCKVMLKCGCTRVVDVSATWLLERFGLEATIEDAESRLICPTCKQRPNLHPHGDYSVSGGRDRRVDPVPMPDWVDLS